MHFPLDKARDFGKLIHFACCNVVLIPTCSLLDDLSMCTWRIMLNSHVNNTQVLNWTLSFHRTYTSSYKSCIWTIQ